MSVIRNLYPEDDEYEALLDKLRNDLAVFLHIHDQKLNTTNDVTFNAIEVTTTLTTATAIADKIELSSGDFVILGLGNKTQLQFDTGDVFSFNKNDDSWDFNIAGAPVPDFTIKQGTVLTNSINSISGDFNVGDSSTGAIVLNRPTQLISAIQDDTVTKILGIDVNNEIVWRDDSSLQPTAGTFVTNWLFAGGSSVAGNIDYQLQNNRVTLLIPSGVVFVANGYTGYIENETLLPVNMRPTVNCCPQFIVRVVNDGVYASGVVAIIGGLIRVSANVSNGSFSGSSIGHTFYSTTFTYLV